jgi:thiol-disulfide isomerase/thioredoxin
VAFSYALGTAMVLYALMLGGQRLTSRLARRSGRLQAAIGTMMVAVAVLMAFELDIRFRTAIADDLPAVLVNPSRELEASAAARERLAELRGGGGGALAQAAEAGGDEGSELPVLGEAPEIVETQQWFNTRGNRPLSLASLRGRAVLVDFWRYSCINCVRTLPYLRAWDARYRERGLTVIGVHAPEFPFERDPDNVARAVRNNGIRYPVAQDNEFATWNAYDNRFWPAKYLIDARGHVRYTHFGEGDYEETEAAIRALLAEAGEVELGARAQATTDSAREGTTPESYLGAQRAERFVHGALRAGTRRYVLARAKVAAIPAHHLGFEGRWRVEDSRSVAAGDSARLHLRFTAARVFEFSGTLKQVTSKPSDPPPSGWQLSQPGMEDRVAIRRRLLGKLLEQAPDAMANLDGARRQRDQLVERNGHEVLPRSGQPTSRCGAAASGRSVAGCAARPCR